MAILSTGRFLPALTSRNEYLTDGVCVQRRVEAWEQISADCCDWDRLNNSARGASLNVAPRLSGPVRLLTSRLESDAAAEHVSRRSECSSQRSGFKLTGQRCDVQSGVTSERYSALPVVPPSWHGWLVLELGERTNAASGTIKL